jgi:outer membrane lipoprotein LolB
VKAGDDGFNGKLRWIQDGDDFTATVGGPIGIGTVRIAGNSESVTLTDKDGIETELEDVEHELMLRYGWTIPVRSLRYWALGIPDPGDIAETAFNNSDELEKLVQRGWIVSISRYKDIDGQSMPSRLLVEGNDTRVRLVVDSWYFFK